jgi:hypothetical protein
MTQAAFTETRHLEMVAGSFVHVAKSVSHTMDKGATPPTHVEPAEIDFESRTTSMATDGP